MKTPSSPPSLARRRIGRFAAALALLLGCIGPAGAADWPAKPIRMIIPFPPGQTSSDVFGRALADRLSRVFGQPVYVENRSGAGGTVGADLVAKAPADGYTLLLAASGTITIAPTLYGARMPFNVQADLQPVSLFALVPYMLVAPPSAGARTARDFVKLAKARPGSLNFVSSGNGTTPHLCGEVFRKQAGIDITHIPYKGGSEATADLLAGRVQLYCAGGPSTYGYVKDGSLVALGLTTARRSAVLPGVPTLAEQGITGMDNINSWVGLLAPAKTPRPVVDRLYAEISKIMATPEMQALVSNQAAEPMALTPDEFGRRIREETAYWANVIQTTHAKTD
ncbi:Bug family tripartite tricarboxylate transporter substrate binding protein [Variovorax terrae]|uniref:Tripartite tricarboxylate transporter substrate binding protein n=1 Tax=Variovorax terrae TaxID=2923278 RepID=A0A9X2AMS0_9BURK|nr:tripartite tricarboxylate transporter substrate binding protein [Variovorax terrae]MCJ0764028.1 tripartite tricarboxylate transporter substrate binding protein [Variovorax terrae]